MRPASKIENVSDIDALCARLYDALRTAHPDQRALLRASLAAYARRYPKTYDGIMRTQPAARRFIQSAVAACAEEAT